MSNILSPQDLYNLGKISSICVEISKMIASGKFTAGAFRYAKTIDYSGKGFDCKAAEGLLAALNQQLVKDPDFVRELEKLQKMTDELVKKHEPKNEQEDD